MAEVWLLLATEMVWWVIFALLMLVGRPVWTIASTCGEMGSQGRLGQTALAMHFQRLYDSGMPLRF